MLAFTVGVLVGACVVFLIVGFWAVVSEDDEKRYLQLAEERRLKQEDSKRSRIAEDLYGEYYR